MTLFRRFIPAFLLLLLLIVPAGAQENSIQMDIDAAFQTHFRPDYWLPLRVRVRNTGADISGRLIVRPETSGTVFSSAYSTPIELPGGSDKTAFLYVQARDIPSRITVELIDAEGVRFAEQNAIIEPIAPEDKLHVVVSGAGASALPFGGIAPTGATAYDVRWTLDNLPDTAAALDAVDTLILYEIDSSALTLLRRQAVLDWVSAGGHLLLIGGANWQGTTAAFSDIMPIELTGTETVDQLSGLSQFIGEDDALEGRSVLAVGSVRGEVLAANSDGTPLLIRGQYGAGTVDFLAADPTLAPLRGWDNLSEFWFTTLATAAPRVGWLRGFVSAQDAATAIAVLPGVDLLPPVLSMILYITAYILLIGPINYLILSRINRRGLAWVTIPLLIIVFSGIAWSVGFNLRGTEIILSRLRVVQSWDDSETARVDELLGILSPRRESYSISMPEGFTLNVIPGLSGGGLLQQNITQSTAEIVQSERFSAENVVIDGGIFANFSSVGTTQRPLVSGTVTRTLDPQQGETLRGSVRNDSDITLTDAVIISRNHYHYLEEPLAPGAVVTFDTRQMTAYREGEELRPAASPLEMSAAFATRNIYRSTQAVSDSLRTARVVLRDVPDYPRREIDTLSSERDVRRAALVRAFMRDEFSAPGIGQEVYLIGWSAFTGEAVQIGEVVPRIVDTELHVIQLDTTVEAAPPAETVSITPEQFTWVIREREDVEGGLNDLLLLDGGTVVVRFMPLAGAVLDTVSNLTIELDRSATGYGRFVELSVWDWENEEWHTFQNEFEDTYTLDDPSRFIGVDNRVDVRLHLTVDIGTARLRALRISQRGQF